MSRELHKQPICGQHEPEAAVRGSRNLVNSSDKPAKRRTTIASYSLAIQRALEANGYDAEGIFEAAGIDHIPGPDPMDRLTTAELAAVYRESVIRSGNPAFGLTVARFMHPSSVHALGYALLASSTLRDACERLVYYFRLASDQGAYRIAEEQGRFSLILEVKAQGVAHETVDAWNAFIIRLFRMIHRPDFTPLAVSLTRPCPAGYEQQYQKSFHVPVRFDAPYCEICLDPSVVDEPLMGGNREIAHQHDRIMEGYITALDKDDIVNRVKKAIIQFLPSESCTKQRVASELAMSASAL